MAHSGDTRDALAPTRTDPAGDFISVYTGPSNGDLDVLAFDAVLTGPDEVTLVATHAAPIGATPGSAYVWGITAAPASSPSRRSTRPRARAWSSTRSRRCSRTAPAP